jgi:peptidoglycan/LPS O-acetylase OafA/YrhL
MLLSGLFMLSDLYGKILRKHETIIRVSASYSFSIYLFHFPLLIFFGEVFDNGLLVISISLLLIVLIGKYSEQKKGVFKAFIVNTSMYKMNYIKK